MAGSVLIGLVRVRQMCLNGEAKRRREEAGLSLEDVAWAVGASTAAISRWERGLARPRRDAALRYGAILAGLPLCAVRRPPWCPSQPVIRRSQNPKMCMRLSPEEEKDVYFWLGARGGADAFREFASGSG